MSIGVQSYPELYTMLLGWDLYGKCWQLLSQTGIAYIPFIGIILKNVGQSYVIHGHKGAEHALRSMELNLIMTLLIIFFGVAPCIPLDGHTVSYSPLCGKDQGNTYYPGSTGTTYDQAFSLPQGDIRVPIWWYAVIAVSEGMTSAAKTMVGCVPDLRKMVTVVNISQITDPAVKEELLDFEKMCYTPAKTQLLNDTKLNNTATLSRIQEDIKKYGVEDTEWVGSHALSDTYYRSLKPSRPVPGFTYDAGQDINSDINKSNPPAYGTPTCNEWWNHSMYGLKKRAYDSLPPSFKNEFKDYIKTEADQDKIVKAIITRTPNYANANNNIGDIGYSHFAAALGIWYNQMTEYPKLYAAAQAEPIIQSLLLLMIYVFLPFALVFSGYKPHALLTSTVIIFSLIFMTFIWQVVSFTDKALMQALYASWFEKQGAGATLTDMIIGSLVIGAPLFWFMLMGSVGVSVGNAVNSATGNMNKIGESAANQGANQTKGMASSAAKLL